MRYENRGADLVITGKIVKSFAVFGNDFKSFSDGFSIHSIFMTFIMNHNRS